MASFETSLYDEDLKPRADFGIADIMGVSKNGDAIGTNGNPYSARIEPAGAGPLHPILQGFHDTTWVAGAQNRVPLKPVDAPLLTVVPGFVRYPPELAYPAHPQTDEPAVVLRESGASRTAWFPGDIERTYWLTGHGDLLRLLLNTIRWVSHDEKVVRVDGAGSIEMFCWETSPGICHSPAQLHQFQRTAWLVEIDQPDWPAESVHKTAIGSRGEVGRTPQSRTESFVRLSEPDIAVHRCLSRRLRSRSGHGRMN